MRQTSVQTPSSLPTFRLSVRSFFSSEFLHAEIQECRGLTPSLAVHSALLLDRCARSYTYLSLLPSSVCSFCLSFFSFLRLFRLLFRSFDTVACRLPALSCRAAEPLRAYTTSPPTTTANTAASSSQRHETLPLFPNRSIHQRPRNRPPFLRTGDMSV